MTPAPRRPSLWCSGGMGSLSYTTSMSLDGYVADAEGDFQWAAPSPEVFAFHVDRMAAVSTEVLGRRTYALMKYWETDPTDEQWGPLEQAFARGWRSLHRVVVSTTLSPDDLGPGPIRLVDRLDLDDLHALAADTDGEVEVFGPTTAAAALRAGLVRDVRILVAPRTVGGGLAAIPQGVQLSLDLVEQRRFGDGTVLLHYRAPGRG